LREPPACYGATVTCSWSEERFERFIDGELADGERARLLAHVDGCDACRGLLEELRVVDALLLTPRTVELPENFTYATMADVKAMPHPCPLRTPLAATLIAYVAGAWSLVGAAALIAPQHLLSASRSVYAVAATVFAALPGSGMRLRRWVGAWSSPTSSCWPASRRWCARAPRHRRAFALVIARLRLLAGLALAILAFAAMPRVASADILDHGKTVFFHNVTIGSDETVDGDLTVVFGDARVAGHVQGDVNTIFGKCIIEDGAQIDGHANCITDDGARALAPWFVNSAAFDAFRNQDKHLLVRFGASAIVLLVFLLFPVRMRIAHDRLERHPGLAALVGAIAVLAIVPVAIILAITIVGIPLIVLEFAAVFVGIWLGTGAVALLVGRRLTELIMPSHTPSPLWASSWAS